MPKTTFLWFYFGVMGLAFVIGAVTGLSSTPVLTTLVPLLFALLTAGGAFYVIKGEAAKTADANKEESLRRAAFLGKQLFAFATGFGLGIWIGVGAKLDPQSLWASVNTTRPAYSEMQFDDMRLLVAAIELDNRMCNSGLEYNSRKEIFMRLSIGLNERAKIVGNGLANIYDSVKGWDNPTIANTFEAADRLQQILEKMQSREYADPETKEALAKLHSQLVEIKNGTALTFDKYPMQQIEKLRAEFKKWNEHPLLTNEDLQIVTGLLDGKLKTDAPSRWHIDPKSVVADNFRPTY